MLQSYFAVIPGFGKMRNPLDEQPGNKLQLSQKHLGFGIQPSIVQVEWNREVLVLVPLVHRRSYCSRGALLLVLPGWSRQDRIIQHFTVAHHPRRFGSCSRRQRLAARSCHYSSAATGDPGNSLRAVLPFPLDSAPELSLTHSVVKIEVAPPNVAAGWFY
jgi:hypothetical protein